MASKSLSCPNYSNSTQTSKSSSPCSSGRSAKWYSSRYFASLKSTRIPLVQPCPPSSLTRTLWSSLRRSLRRKLITLRWTRGSSLSRHSVLRNQRTGPMVSPKTVPNKTIRSARRSRVSSIHSKNPRAAPKKASLRSPNTVASPGMAPLDGK